MNNEIIKGFLISLTMVVVSLLTSIIFYYFYNKIK